MKLKEYLKDKMIKILGKFLPIKLEQKLINRIIKYLIINRSQTNKVHKKIIIQQKAITTNLKLMLIQTSFAYTKKCCIANFSFNNTGLKP